MVRPPIIPLRAATALALLLAALAAGCGGAPEATVFPELSGPLLGQAPPGLEPVLFAPGIVSNGLDNIDMAISPDGREIMFGLQIGDVNSVLATSLDGTWSEPAIPEFAADLGYFTFEPFLTFDGRWVYFLTNRPLPGEERQPGWRVQHIFRSRRDGEGWTEPEPVPGINTGRADFYPSFTTGGTLYYTHQDSTGNAIYRVRPEGDDFGEPQRLPAEVNCAPHCYNACVAPDESFVIVCAQGHPENRGVADYWISFRGDDDVWTPAVNLGPKVNFENERGNSPYISPDGKWFFFSSTKSAPEASGEAPLEWADIVKLQSSHGNGRSDMYWVSAALLEEMRPE